MSFKKRLKSKFSGWLEAHSNGSQMSFSSETVRELRMTNDLLRQLIVLNTDYKNPLNAFGRKVFSQSDEDGITLEILRRLNIGIGVAVEIGSGDGTENNSLVLLAAGWRCVWIDLVEVPQDQTIFEGRLKRMKTNVSLENLDEVLQEISSWAKEINFLSVDVDGMEGYLTTGILARGFRPEVLVVEINRMFPPPLVFKQKYDPAYVWDKRANSGWSLQTYVDELREFGYKLIACNGHTGVNAFFVLDRFAGLFPEVPKDIRDIFIGRGTRNLKYGLDWLVADKGTVDAILKNEN